MQREIKFRGKHIHAMSKNGHLNGTWVYGYLSSEDYINSPKLEGEFLVDKNTIGQFVGIKDKNGKEIYEGDLITIDQEDEEDLLKIEWDESTSRFIMTSNLCYTYDFDNYSGSDCEVVGNIYDNSNLIS